LNTRPYNTNTLWIEVSDCSAATLNCSQILVAYIKTMAVIWISKESGRCAFKYSRVRTGFSFTHLIDGIEFALAFHAYPRHSLEVFPTAVEAVAVCGIREQPHGKARERRRFCDNGLRRVGA
jgi:hypothetical protein